MEIDCRALGSTAIEYKYVPRVYKYDVETFLYREGRRRIIKTLRTLMARNRHVKIQVSLQIQISRLREDETTVTMTPWFNSETLPLVNTELIRQAIVSPIKQILSNWDGFIHLGELVFFSFLPPILLPSFCPPNLCFFLTHFFFFLFFR